MHSCRLASQSTCSYTSSAIDCVVSACAVNHNFRTLYIANASCEAFLRNAIALCLLWTRCMERDVESFSLTEISSSRPIQLPVAKCACVPCYAYLISARTASYRFCEGKESVHAITALHVLRASCFRKNATQTRKRVSQTTFMDSRCLVLLGEECVTSQRVFYTLPYRQDDARTNYQVSRFRVIYCECKNDRI